MDLYCHCDSAADVGGSGRIFGRDPEDPKDEHDVRLKVTCRWRERERILAFLVCQPQWQPAVELSFEPCVNFNIMMLRSLSRIAVLSALLLLSLGSTDAFPMATPMIHHRGSFRLVDHQSIPQQAQVATTALSMSPNRTSQEEIRRSDAVGGMKEGYIGLAIVFLFNVWMFSIPPHFRRDQICPPDLYVTPEVAETCVPFDTMKQELVDYYKNGGGIQFDFSIDPRTLERNQETWNSIFGEPSS